MKKEKPLIEKNEVFLLGIKFLGIIILSAVFVAYKNKILQKQEEIRIEEKNDKDLEFFFNAFFFSIVTVLFIYIVLF